MTAWLKVIGTTERPLRDDWADDAPSLVRRASFGRRPGQGSFVPGDVFAYYALRGDLSRVVAVGRVVGRVYYEAAHAPGWPWLVPVELDARADHISRGFSLDLLTIDRDLLRSVQRRSHLRLTSEEFGRARQLFGLTP